MSQEGRRAGALFADLAQSKGFRATTRFLRRFWSTMLVVAVVVGVIIAAVVTPGFRVADLRLNEAAVYVVRQSTSLVGNLNMPSEELANAALVGAQQYEVIQNADQVLVKSSTPNQISNYDPATNQMGSPTNLPNSATVSVNGGVMVVANPTNGRVWYGPVDEMLRTDFQLAPAQLEIGEGGLAIATSSGKVIALNVTSSTLVRPGAAATPLSGQVPLTIDPANAGAVRLSAVGEKAVVLDTATQRIWVEGTNDVWDVDGGTGAVLPDPSPTAAGGVAGAQAIYATAAGLIAVTKDGPRSLTGLVNAAPVKPLIFGDCVYGAFGTTYAKRCAGSDAATTQTIPQVPQGADLRFGRNRGSVVLNDADSGYIWLVEHGMKLITDWSQVTPTQDDDSSKDSPDTQVINPDRKGPNQPPVARADMSLAAREGRSTILPVLDNDYDPDGDLLTVLGPPTAKGGPTFQLVNGGSGLQVTVPSGHKGAIDFDYTISDGRGKSATAHARVNVLPADQQASNQKPFHLRPDEKLVLAQLQQGTKRVLLDWRDPDGDDLILVDADVEGEDEVTFTADGTLHFQDVGKTTGLKTVKLKVSDGVAVTEGELVVEVVKGRVAAPIANGDFYNATVGTELVMSPLANDQGENLTLREVTLEGTGQKAQLQPNYHENTIRFTGEAPGTYYLVYTVSNGPVSTGLIRVDVRGASKQNNKPVAARDVVLLPPGGSVLVDPLANDFDADGDVLVIQSFDAPSELNVVMQNRHLLTVTANRTPTRPVAITYWISDGTTSTQGTIVVVPTQLAGSQRPEAKPDEVKARAGSIVTIPVLANDTSPVGLDLSLTRLVEGPKDRMWIDGDKVRVAVPSGNTSASMSVTYEITDTDGRTASSVVNITIVSPDAQNEAPTPRLIEARVLQGTTTRILIPMDGIDPNGDPVRLVGLGAGPHLGRITQVGERYLSYEAFPTSQGTDVFRYQVVDAHGATATGEIRVGVAPQIGGNNPPSTGDDQIRVKPGATVTMPLLLNDEDIDGDNIGFVDTNAIDLPFATKIVNGNSITFTAPTKPGTHAGKYYVRDSANTLGNGAITVVVDESAPPLAPVATDDLVQPQTVVDKEYIDIEALKNDYDLDDDSAKLTVTLPGNTNPDISVAAGGKVRAKVLDGAQQVRYTITDKDGGSSTAVITVPGRNDVRPVLKDPAPLTATAGERLVLDLNQLVQGTRGRPVRLVSADRVRATNGAAIPSPQKIEWTPSIDYEGPAAVVFEVTDEVPEGDKTARNAFISVPMTVKPAPNAKTDEETKKKLTQLPPELIGTAPVLEVGAGENETRLDLNNFFRDPNGDEFRFEKWGKSGGDANLTWRAVGDQQNLIYATAPVDAKPGGSVTLSGRVMDIHGNDRPAQMTIRIVPSTRPLPDVGTDTVNDANAGQPRAVNVLENDKSNLLTDKSLTIVSARALGAGDAKVSGQQVVVTPPREYVPEMVVEYTVMDATLDPNRQRTGKILVQVRGEPGAPGVPREVKSGDGYVTLTWTDGAVNGLPIKSRILQVSRADAGGTTGKSVECQTSTCTIDGLANGKNYWFKVTQTNELGQATSGESGSSKPDVIPEVVGKPEVKFGNGQLTITWPAGVSRGSPVTEYRVTKYSGGKTETLPSKTTSLTWTGLTNDEDYTFTVAAKNVVGWSKQESPASTPEHPTGPPQPATNVTGADAGVGIGKHITVNWSAAPVKKDPILRYQVFATQVNNGRRELIATVDAGGALSVLWDRATNDVEYQFSVIAYNRGPDPGQESAKSAPVSAFGAPSKPVGANLRAGDGSLWLNAGDPNQPQVTEYEVQVMAKDGGAVGSAVKVKVGDQIPGTFRNGQTYYAMVRAWNQTKASDWGGTNSATPVGTPSAPYWGDAVAISGDGAQREVRWTMPDDNLQGNSRDQVTIQYDAGGGWVAVPNVQHYGSAGGGQFGTINIKTNGANVTVRIRAVSTGHGASPAEGTTVTAPLTMALSGSTLKVSSRGIGSDLSCSVSAPFSTKKNAYLPDNGSFTVDHDGGATPPPPPYTATVSCKASILSSPMTLTKTLG
ncbi:Ig-like domain-containing protein [Propionibacteriaceae bacterium G1746]